MCDKNVTLKNHRLQSVINNLDKTELDWQVLLEELVETFSLSVCHMIVLEKQSMTIRYHLDAGKKTTDDLGRTYLQIGQGNHVMRHVLNSPPREKFLAVSRMPDDQKQSHRNSEFFKKWCEPQAFADSANLCLFEENNWVTMLVCNRDVEVGRFKDDELFEMNRLVLPLRMAANRIFSEPKQDLTAARFNSLLETFRIPVAVLSEQGRLYAMNKSMEQLLSSQPELTIQDQCFVLKNKKKNQMLYSNLIQATKRLDVSDGYTLVDNDTIDLETKVTIGLQALESQISTQVRHLNGVMVYALSPQLIKAVDIKRLMELFALTEKEAMICQQLALGKPVKRIALEDGISVNTVKFHVKHIFIKTGCRDKLSLASMINAIPGASLV